MPSRAIENRPLHPWEEDRYIESLRLEREVRAAVDPSVSVRRHEEDWSVTVDWKEVGSVEEALEITKEKVCL